MRASLLARAINTALPFQVHPQHIHEQGFLDFIEQRRKLGKPLFYAPERARAAAAGNPLRALVERHLIGRGRVKFLRASVRPPRNRSCQRRI
jgi:hypothetical protein